MLRKHNFVYHVLVILVTYTFVSCSVIGLNVNRNTPARPGKYPEFTLKDSLSGTLNAYRSCYDVFFYDLSITFDIKNRFIDGKSGIYFNASDQIDTLQIDLYENMDINSITLKGKELNYHRKYNAVFVYFSQTMEKGDSGVLEVDYSGKPEKAINAP